MHAAAASWVLLMLVSGHGLTGWVHALQAQCRKLPLGPAPILGEHPFHCTHIPVVSHWSILALTWQPCPLPAADTELARKSCLPLDLFRGPFQHTAV